MAPAYKNVNSGQIVVSDEPRPDLEALARWDEVPVPDETSPTEAAVAEAAAREAASTPPAVEIVAGDGQPVEVVGEAVKDGEIVTPAVIEMADGSEVNKDEDGNPILTPIEEVKEVPVPDETWTHDQLDDLAKTRDIKFPANTNKAAKVTKLTEG